MKHILCVRLKQWPIDRLRRGPLRRRHDPLVLAHVVATRPVVAAACHAARDAGIRTGMPLAEARALCPAVTCADHRPDKDLKSLHGLARWMFRFSPTVALEPPDALMLDITGSERLFHGFPRLLRLVSESLSRLGLHHAAAVAHTPGAAWALASFGRIESQIIPEDQVPAALAPLPVHALRLDADTIETLHRLGVETIGQLTRVPRETLPARLGAGVLRRIDQALGKIAEPLLPVGSREPVRASIDFDGEVESLQVIQLAFQQLLGSVICELRGRGCGARRLLLEFLLPRSPAMQKTIHLSRPTCDPVGLFKLLQCAAETIKGVSGFTGLRLSVPVFERLSDEQLALLGQATRKAAAEYDHLLERLQTRLGPLSVLFPRLVESHLPERCYRYVENGSHPPPSPRPLLAAARPFPKPRPLHLLEHPVEVRCTTFAAPARDGPPLSFSHDHQVHSIARASGPERIAGIWWEGRDKTRDYFDVEDSTGRRFWLFRVVETYKWYLHGVFDG